jgi:hypothetical protein
MGIENFSALRKWDVIGEAGIWAVGEDVNGRFARLEQRWTLARSLGNDPINPDCREHKPERTSWRVAVNGGYCVV